MADAVQTLILDIYDTLFDPGRWPEVLDRTADAVGALGIIIFDLSPEGEGLRAPLISSRYERDAVEAYLAQHGRAELADQTILARHAAAGDDISLVGDEVLAGGPKSLAAQPNARAMAEFGIFHRAGALLNKDDPSRHRFSIQFSRRHGPLGPTDRRALALVLPHMAKALDLAGPLMRLQELASTLSASLDRLRVGVCLIRRDRAIIVQNSEFRRQVAECGIFHVRRDGRLDMRERGDREWFLALTSDPDRHGRFGARARKEAMNGLRPCAACDLSVEIAPLTSLDAFGETRLDGYAVYSLDTRRPLEIDVAAVSRAFALTGSESELLGLIADGLTNREIANRRQRSIETVNSQVKSLLAKSDCANRTQLIRRAATVGNRIVG